MPMPRRTRGTGSLCLRGRIWWYVYRQHGQQIWVSSKSMDEEEAKRQLAVRLGEIAAGADVTPERATVADLCRLVIADYRLRKLRSLPDVQWRFDAHIVRLVGSLPAGRFGARQAKIYIETRRAEDASDATINRELAIIRRGFTLAHQEDPPLVRRVPHIPKLEEDNARQGFIEEAQYVTLRGTLPEHLQALLVVGYHCGCRLGELRKLRWPQVDLNALEIRIEKRQAKAKQARTIPIYGDMIQWLKWQATRRDGDLVFHWNGKPLGSHLKGWAKACTAAGIDGLHFHDLRRSAVRNMERAGIPRSVAMGITGHKTEAVYKRYDIVGGTDLTDAARKLTEYHKSQRPKLKLIKGRKSGS